LHHLFHANIAKLDQPVEMVGHNDKSDTPDTTLKIKVAHRIDYESGNPEVRE
jgi:hypothetical protein